MKLEGDIEGNAVVETPELDAVPKKKKAPAKVATVFKIVKDEKRTMKKSVSGQCIEALKRAKAPLSLAQVKARVFGTATGKGLAVKDDKGRVLKCLEWYYKDENNWVEKTEDGKYFLAMVPA